MKYVNTIASIFITFMLTSNFVVADTLRVCLDTSNMYINVNCDVERETELVCLACNIYHEARGEDYSGQLAVANVTRNRVRSERFPNSLCDVVWQRWQFSWTKDGRSDRIHDNTAWRHAIFIAQITIDEKILNDVTHGSLWYHASHVSPVWTTRQTPSTEIGGHKFYTRVATAAELLQ